MLFNSIDFAIFLPLVFILYWFVTNKSLKLQNFLIVVSSYIFYGWWDWRFLLLIFVSTNIDYFIGLLLSKQENQTKRKALIWASVTANLGLLGVFKYYDFFLDNFKAAFSFFGSEISVSSLDIILPVGISFYTFQTLSYSIDVYKRKLKPTDDFIAFAAFVSFFPQLVAGPIERAANLLPQFYTKRIFDYSNSVDGLRQILWGLFKKVVIADNCAEYVNLIFNNSSEYSGSTLALGALFFTIQIYGDFSGYSDIAIGTSRLFGFNLMQNFAFPYFSRDFAEVWRKWHISLSTWFRDYLFIPLMKTGTINAWTKIRNVFVLFILIGIWHGANWTFIVWGGVQAVLFIPTFFRKNKQKNLGVVAKGKALPSFRESLLIVKTFSLIAFSMIFFRAENIGHAINYISEILSPTLFSIPSFPGRGEAFTILLLIVLFFVVEWQGREGKYALDHLVIKWKKPLRYGIYYAIIIAIFWFGGREQEFIYFQF